MQHKFGFAIDPVEAAKLEPEAFKEAPKPDFGAQDNQKGDAVVQQVAAFWKSLGLSFPLEGVLERN